MRIRTSRSRVMRPNRIVPFPEISFVAGDTGLVIAWKQFHRLRAADSTRRRFDESDRSDESDDASATAFFIPFVHHRSVPQGNSKVLIYKEVKFPRELSFPESYVRNWWSQAESNRRPLECHSSALPTELWPLQGSVISRQGSVIGGHAQGNDQAGGLA
jgi:hypothetical protein